VLRRVLAGDRRVWLVAAVTGALFAAAIAYYLLDDRYPTFTGTNSVGYRGPVVDVHAGQRLCVPQLVVPPRTGFVRFKVRSGPSRPGFATQLQAGQTVIRSRIPPAPARGDLAVDVPIPQAAGLDADVPGRLCLTPLSGSVGVGGMANVYQDLPQTAPTLDGTPLPNARIGVWFLPPSDERHSLLSQSSDVLERATLFRPGFVGEWTYAVLLLVLLPLILVAAIRLLALAADGSAPRMGAAGAVALIAFGNAFVWVLVTPPFDTPDEIDHFAYAQSIAETGTAPEPAGGKRSPWSSEEVVALDGVRLVSYIEQPDGRPPWLPVDERAWAARERREDPVRDNGGGYQSTSTHSPLYYSLVTPPYLLLGGQSIFSRITAMRMVSALLGALTALFAFALVLELLPRRPFLAVAAGLLVAFQPMFSFMSGAINNDMGVNAAAAALLFLLMRGLRRGLTVPLAAAIGVTLVVAPLAKGTALALYPAAALALGGMLWRRRSRADLPAYATLAAAFGLAVVAWALIAPAFDRSFFTTPGGTSPTGSGGVGTQVLENPTAYLSYLWQEFLPRLPFMTDLHPQRWPAFDIYVERGWAAFGWYAIMFPRWVYVAIAGTMLAAGALCGLAIWRERAAARPRALELTVLVVAIAGMVVGVAAAYFTPEGRSVVAEQGRYAFTVIGALAAVAIGACVAFGRGLIVTAATVMVAAMMSLSVASLLLALSGFYL
jgi:4-amino-4-deoxy-L-arabinose transferase-like glycosyltransferase